jgi:hypothetical protein
MIFNHTGFRSRKARILIIKIKRDKIVNMLTKCKNDVTMRKSYPLLFSNFMRNIYIFLLISIFFLYNKNLRAQQISIGIKGGISIPSLKAGGADKNPLSQGYTSRLGPNAAMFAVYRFSTYFHFRCRLNIPHRAPRKADCRLSPFRKLMLLILPQVRFYLQTLKAR